MENLYESFVKIWEALSPEEQSASRTDMVQTIEKLGKRELLKPMLILDQLGDYLAINPLPAKESDFMAPGYLDYILARVCERMSNDEKLSCSREYVLEIWLSKTLYMSQP